MKPKPKSKVPIAESTSVNAGATDDVHTPLMHNTANKDNTGLDSGVSVGLSDAITATSPTAKKPKGELTSTKSLVDKKKMDVRKKSLKRL